MLKMGYAACVGLREQQAAAAATAVRGQALQSGSFWASSALMEERARYIRRADRAI